MALTNDQIIRINTRLQEKFDNNEYKSYSSTDLRNEAISSDWLTAVKDFDVKDMSDADLKKMSLENAHVIVQSQGSILHQLGVPTTLAEFKENVKITVDATKGTPFEFLGKSSQFVADSLDKLASTPSTPEEQASKAVENRLSEQAALMLTIDELLGKIVKEGTVDSSSPDPTTRLYKNFTTIRCGANNVGHSFLTSNLTKTPSMNSFFKKIPSQVMSFLIPSIKIYKTFYPVSSVSSERVIGYDWRVPFDDVPVSYRGETSEFVVKSADEVLNGNGGLRGVGIKSFSYEYKGVNPAEVNTNIHATMELFFQNPAELVKKIPLNFNDARFTQNPKQGQYQPISFAYSDLINQTSKDKDGKLNDQYYRIKVECGYADISPKILTELLETAKYIKEEQVNIIDAIKSTKVILFLSPYSYDVNFNEDSTVTLKINFHCAMDIMMASPDADIFSLTPDAKALAALSKEYETYLLANSKEVKLGDKPPDNECLSMDETKKAIEDFKSKHPTLVNKTTEEILEDLSRERTKAYNGLFSYLIGSHRIHDSEHESQTFEPKLYIASFKPDILGIRESDAGKDKKEESKARLDRFMSGNQLYSVAPLYLDSEAPLVEIPANTPASDAENQMISTLSSRQAADLASETSVHNIKFILLGDIMDIALESLNNVGPSRDLPRVAIGNIPIEIPTEFLEGQGKYSTWSKMKEINPNLADIPISYNLFQEFMIKNVVTARKTRYPVIQFINDIISQLIGPAISPKVLGQSAAINASIRFSTTYMSFQTDNGKDMFTDRDADSRLYPPIINDVSQIRLSKLRSGKTTSTQKIGDKPQGSGFSSLDTPSAKYVNYMFITCTSKFPRHIDGDEDTDINKGILHLRMGTDTGIIKKFHFSKMDAPYQREVIARREGNGFGTSLKQFYNATVELFGNDIFRPGDFIYIHPNYMYTLKPAKAGAWSETVSSAKPATVSTVVQTIDLEDSLGVGGYYLVLNVKTDINDMAYGTKLQCIFQAHVEQDNNGKKKIKAMDEKCKR